MKKLGIIAIFLISALPAFAEEFEIRDLSGGMYSNATSDKIPDNSAALIQNFFSDIEPALVERNGYTKRDTTVLGGTKPVTGLWAFIDSTGSEWIVSFSSRSFYKNTIGGTPTKFGLNASAATIPDAAVSLGRIWFVNGTDSLWWFDGTSTGSVSSAPIGRLIESWRNRIVIANITSSQSTIRFSADGDGETWTLGGNATDPFSLEIGGANDGQYVRCMRGSYLDSIIIGRKYDLWAVDGFDQEDIELRNISTQIGCIESNSMQEVDGALVFLSGRGIEEMRGRAITMISEPIRNVTDVIVKNTANQRSDVQTLQNDWSAGTMDNSVYLDTHTAPGSVQHTFPDLFDSYRDGTSSTKKVWLSSQSFSSSITSTASVSSGQLRLEMGGGTLAESYVQTAEPLNNFQQGTTYYVTIASVPFTGVSNVERFWLVFSSRNVSTLTSTPHNGSSYFSFLWTSTNVATVTLQQITNNVDGGLTHVSTSVAPPFNFAVYLSTTLYQYSVNGTRIGGGTHNWPNNAIYTIFAYQHGGSGAGSPAAALLLDNFGVTPQTATFTSQKIDVGSSISSWGPVTISETEISGSIDYTFGSTSTANISDIVNYTSISNGASPTVATNPTAAFKAFFSNTLATSSVKLDEFVTTWNEGAAIPSPASAVYDRRYWISFTTSTETDPRQETVFVWQRTKSWVMFRGIHAASFTTPLWRDALYFGDSRDLGYVYKFDVGNSDDSGNIESAIVTKSYDLGQPFREKDFIRAYTNYNASSLFSGSFDFSYDMDRYGSPYSLGSASLSEANGLASIKFPFGISNLVRGREVQFRLTKTGTSDRLKLGSISTQYQIVEER